MAPIRGPSYGSSRIPESERTEHSEPFPSLPRGSFQEKGLQGWWKIFTRFTRFTRFTVAEIYIITFLKGERREDIERSIG
jgi:hypothetical protein